MNIDSFSQKIKNLNDNEPVFAHPPSHIPRGRNRLLKQVWERSYGHIWRSWYTKFKIESFNLLSEYLDEELPKRMERSLDKLVDYKEIARCSN